MKYRVLVGLLLLVGVGLEISCGGSGSTTTTNPGVTGTSLLFVATQGDQKLSPFTINLATGVAATNGNGVATGALPIAGVMTPTGDAIFVANQTSGDISHYTIKNDGTLTAVTPTVPSGTNPVAMSMDAAGKFLFVLNQGSFGLTGGSTISVFSIGQGGTLTAVGSPVSGTYLDNSSSIVVTPDGKFLYVSNSLNNNISGFSVDGSGALTHLGEVSSGITPTAMTVTPDDPANPSSNPIFLYVANANAGAGNISVFEICDKASPTCVTSNGDIKEITGSPFVAGGEPSSMVIVNPKVITPPSGTFLYVADRKLNRVLQYAIAIVSGSLNPLSPASVSTGTTPVWVSARHDGQYVFAANNGSTSVSSLVIHDPTQGNLGNGGTTIIPTGNSPSVVLVK